MEVKQVRLTLVEHEGRRWLVGEGGAILATLEHNPGLCDEAEAIAAVERAMETKRREVALFAEIKADRDLRVRWAKVLRRAIKVAHAGTMRRSEAGDAWARRIDASAKAIYLMVKRGSNLRERGEREPGRTWEWIFANAFIRSYRWYDHRRWDGYSTNLASNLRKRFRHADPGEARSRPDGGHAQEEDRQGDPRGSGLQVLFDWA
jgi:hypothetical protein